jgi:hypothetical protein
LALPLSRCSATLTFDSGLHQTMEVNMGRGILLWLLGVPIPIIIILALLFH